MCDNPIEKHQELISSIGVGSTPSIYLPNGRLIQGYMSPDEVIQKIRN
jgi:protein-disulfide isomerase